MKAKISRWLLVVLLTGCGARAEIVDRVVATVNGRIILQSDWDAAVCYEAFAAGHLLDKVTPADRKGALDRLIDQELLREQMRASERHATAEDVQKRVQEIRRQYSSSESDSVWLAALRSYGLTQKDLEARLATELDLLSLVDARLRPTIQIDNRSIESYYQQTLVPQLRDAGGKEVALAEVTPKIKELLTQQKMDQLLVAWLQNLRAESDIRRPAAVSDSGDGPGGQQH